MPTHYVIDRTVISQINLGNRDLIQVMANLFKNGSVVWMANDTYNHLNQIEMAFVDDLPIAVSLKVNDDMYLKSKFRNNAIPGKAELREEWMRTAALAFNKSADLITMDPAFRTAWRKMGGTLESQSSNLGAVQGAVNYNGARQAFNLKPVTIAGDTIVPTEKGPGPKPKTPAKPSRYEGQDDDPATKEYGPSATGEAAMAGGVIALQGVNMYFKWVNGKINKRAFDAAWAKIEPGVTKTLNDDPSLGAVIIANYVETPAGEASVIDGAVKFNGLQVSYGHTRFEAENNIQTGYGAAGSSNSSNSSSEKQWKEPKQPLDISQIPTPFPTQVLATFVKGKELLVRAGFKHAGGFYQLHGRDDTKIDLPRNGVQPQFLVLSPPSTVEYFYFSHWNKKDVDFDFKHPGESEGTITTSSGFPRFPQGLAVVELNSDTTAAMVYPADKTTESLFRATPETDDLDGLLGRYDMELIRWVEPENLHQIKGT